MASTGDFRSSICWRFASCVTIFLCHAIFSLPIWIQETSSLYRTSVFFLVASSMAKINVVVQVLVKPIVQGRYDLHIMPFVITSLAICIACADGRFSEFPVALFYQLLFYLCGQIFMKQEYVRISEALEPVKRAPLNRWNLLVLGYSTAAILYCVVLITIVCNSLPSIWNVKEVSMVSLGSFFISLFDLIISVYFMFVDCYSAVVTLGIGSCLMITLFGIIRFHLIQLQCILLILPPIPIALFASYMVSRPAVPERTESTLDLLA